MKNQFFKLYQYLYWTKI